MSSSNLFNEDNMPSEAATSTMFPYSSQGQGFFAKPPPSSLAVTSAPPAVTPSGLGTASNGGRTAGVSRPGIINQSAIAAALAKSLGGGTRPQQQLDPSEFPSLGRPPAAPSPLRPPNYGSVLHQPSKEEFTIQQEDFPALPGSEPVAGSPEDIDLVDPASSTASAGAAPPLFQSSSAPPAVAVPSLPATSSGALRPIGSAGGTVGAPAMTESSASTGASGIQFQQGVASGVPRDMVRDQFGVVGLLAQLRSHETAPDPSLRVVTNQGVDLTQLGLNLTSAQELHPTFGSPWAEHCQARPQDMACAVPAEYLVHVYIRDKLPAPPIEHMSQETLFWLFYNCCQEALQLSAAKELHKRDWRWIKSERLWVTRSGQGFEKLAAERGERGVYNCWDVAGWQARQRQLVIPYDQIDNSPPSFPNLPVLLPSAAQGSAAAVASMAASSGGGGGADSDIFGKSGSAMQVL